MEPSLSVVLEELAAAGIAAVQVLPLFLAPGTHTRRDLPALVEQVQQRHPGLQVAIGATLLESAPARLALVHALGI
jgi:sirohydrochlorin cobaltochelatase